MKEEVKVVAVIQRANKKSHADNQRSGSYVNHLLNQDGTRKESGSWCESGDYSEHATVLHILYNRIRYRTPHLGSEEKDEEYLSGKNPEHWMVPQIYEALSKKYASQEEGVLA